LIQDREDGFRYIVDADIKSFFDCIDHEVAMSLIRQEVADGRVLDLLESFLKNGISDAGTIHIPAEGAPQGGVISPLISNIVLNQLDKALEAKGWRFVRYVDDFVVLTRSREEANRALDYVKEVLRSLKLTLSEEKTRIASPKEGFDFLGFRIQTHSIAVRPKSLDRFKDKVRTLTRRQQGKNVDAVLEKLNPVLRGWAGYFGWGNVQRLFWRMDQWIRSRIRGFKFKRKCRNDNHRLTNRRLEKWGLLSLQKCRPTKRFVAGRVKLREGAGSPKTGNSHGAAQCGNTAC
jgi:group II intron reverse transcriptase/maturase